MSQSHKMRHKAFSKKYWTSFW